MDDYHLSDFAAFLESFDGKIIRIETESEKEPVIEILISIGQFAHLLGMQYCYSGESNKAKYKGRSGFGLLKNGQVTIDQLESAFHKNKPKDLTWKYHILPRFEWLPAFLNGLTRKEYLLCENGKTNTKLKGDYLLFKTANGDYAILSLAKTGRFYSCESFIINSGLNYYDPALSIKIKSVEIFGRPS